MSPGGQAPPVAVSPDGRELAVTESSVEHELRFLPLRFPN
jgi:hypothetical protein